jgi:hypothetical protein
LKKYVLPSASRRRLQRLESPRLTNRFMEHITAREGVWVTTRADIAKHWRAQYPYETVGAQREVHATA